MKQIKKGKEVVLFGAGLMGIRALRYFIKNGIHVKYYCDNNKKLIGTKTNGVKIVSPMELKNEIEPIVIITSGLINEIKIQLEKIGVKNIFYFPILGYVTEKIEAVNDEKIIEKNKKSIERIGPVNMEVNDQHRAEIERYEFLEKQYNDLVKSKKSLEETMTKLDAEARKRFKNTFEKIKTNFSKTYNMFYEGGKAGLELKGNDVLDAEIIIKATPPGKSTQSLRMLSSGEKAITAIALLFAIYLVKPSPFCILDEVDAPLDDLNIKRFNSVIKEFSKNSQFIIVTHNKLPNVILLFTNT